MKRIRISLALTLSIVNSLFGQDFKKEIKDGLYLWSGGLVIQQVSDTFRIFKLAESKQHFYKVAGVVSDFYTMVGAQQPIPADLYPISDNHRPSDVLLKSTKIRDIIEFGKSRFSIIFPSEKGFTSANFIKCEFGYEIHFSSHDSIGNRIKKSILKDTTTYFRFHAFTLNDLKNLEKLKRFSYDIQSDADLLQASIKSQYNKFENLLKSNMAFGIEIEGYKHSGIIEVRELYIKSLLELKCNPLVDPSKLDGNPRKK